MTRAQRRIHLVLWLVLTPVAGLLFGAAVLARPGPPALDTAQDSPTPSGAPAEDDQP